MKGFGGHYDGTHSGDRSRTGELGELPAQEGGQSRPTSHLSISVLSRLAIKLPDARACVYTCAGCTRTNGHTPRDLGLFSHGLGLLFQCGPD